MTRRPNQLTILAKKIVGGYRPEGIILLEAGGAEKRGSVHLDLVVVKETSKPPPQRRGEVEGLLSGSEASVDVAVYTPDELHYLYSIGDPFIHRIMREGRLVYMRKATMLWVAEAKEELESAMVLNDHKLNKAACYHSRQAVEKGLHAMIMSKVKSPETSDDIVELYNRANALGFKTGLSVEDVVYVNSFGVHRYPVEDALLPRLRPSGEDAERAIDCARRLVEKLALVKTPKSLDTETQC
jgi:HEPN domain-containing protein